VPARFVVTDTPGVLPRILTSSSSSMADP
jgi:hypothetical protein